MWCLLSVAEERIHWESGSHNVSGLGYQQNMVISQVDLDWRKIVLPVMEHYTEATDGSWIEIKKVP